MAVAARVERIWQEERPAWAWRAVLRAASFAYAAGRLLHRALYATGAARRARLPAVVVSVGNLVAGGVGKTPFCAWLAGELVARGRRVVVLARGYGRAPGAALNDEGAWLVAKLPAVRVVQAPDRATAGARALAEAPCDVVLLDDGFQHERLERDLDVVLVDAARPFANGFLLPRGPLRERPAALRRARWIVATRAEQADAATLAATRAQVGALAPAARFATARFPIAAVRRAGAREPAASLEGARLFLCTAVGAPASVRRTLVALGGELVGEQLHPDHHRFTAADLARAQAQADAARALLVVTEKDAVKLDALAIDAPSRYAVVEQAVEVDGGAALVDAILALSRSSSP